MDNSELYRLRKELEDHKTEIEALKSELSVLKSVGSESTFNSFLNNSPSGIAISDENGLFRIWNNRMVALTGISDKLALGKDYKTILNLINQFNIGNADESLRIVEDMLNSIRPDDPETLSAKHKLNLHFPEKGRVDLENILFSFKTQYGRQQACFVNDITEQRKFEEDILLYKMIFENNLDGIAILDLDQNYILSNKAHSSITGYSSEEIIAKKPSLFLGEKLFYEIYKVYDYQKLFEGELKGISRSKSELILDYVLFPVYSENVHLCTIEIIRDISFRKKAEKQVFDAMRKAELADKLKTAFLSNMSHEIRTPMNAILGFSTLLENPDISVDKSLKYINYISKSGKYLLHIIDDIIDIAKIESNQLRIKKSIGSLSALMNNLFLTLARMKEKEGKKTVELRKSFEKNHDLRIYTDFHRLEQILLNLNYNAIKFTNEGFIECGYRINEAKKEILFFCKDTGIGIPKEKLDHIFERFNKVEYSKSKIYSGAGLGLAISSQLVYLLGGNIWVESELNSGSCFYFTIPYIEMEDTEELPVDLLETDKKINWIDKKILIVEDDLFNFELLNELLSETNVEIFHASDGRQALSMFSDTENIDLVLMDIQLPGINGLEATKLILEINPNVPIIAQSAYAMNEDRELALSAGCKDFTPKPIGKKMLFKILREYLD